MPLPSPSRLSAFDCDRFQALVRDASGLEIPETRRLDLERAVAQALAEAALPDTDALFRLLSSPGAGGRRPVLDNLVAALTVGETHFFRNRAQFDALAKHILPDLMDRRRAERRLRLWSAGCASGEEPYSLAILMDWLLPELQAWDVSLLATDINRAALDKARRGVYGSWSFREVPPEVQAAYFIPRGRDLEVQPRIRERVKFAYLNLMEDAYPSLLTDTVALDLILFRNVLIYFRESTARRVVERLHAALADDAWLIVGHADQSPTLFQTFMVRSFPGVLAYQKALAPTAPLPPPARSVPPAFPSSPPVFRPLVERPARRPAVPPPAPAPALVSDDHAQAQAHWERGRPDEALRLLQRLADTQPANWQAPYLAARIEANRVQLEAAEKWLRLALDRNALHAPAHYLQGLVLQALGQLEPAAAALRRCVYADPTFVLGHFALAGLLGQLGQPGRAEKALANVTRLLAGRDRAELLPEGDGMTVGRLLELAAAQKVLT